MGAEYVPTSDLTRTSYPDHIHMTEKEHCGASMTLEGMGSGVCINELYNKDWTIVCSEFQTDGNFSKNIVFS